MNNKFLNMMFIPINKVLLIAILILSLAFCAYPTNSFAQEDASDQNQDQPKKKKGRPKKDEYSPLPPKRHMLPNFDPDNIKAGKPIEKFQNRTDLTKWLDEVIRKNRFGMVPTDENVVKPFIFIPVLPKEIDPSTSTGYTPVVEPVSPEEITPVSPEDINPGPMFFPNIKPEEITRFEYPAFPPMDVDALYVSPDYNSCSGTDINPLKYILVGGAVIGIAACVAGEYFSAGTLSPWLVPATAGLAAFIISSIDDSESTINKEGKDLISYEYEGNTYLFDCTKKHDGVICTIENS